MNIKRISIPLSDQEMSALRAQAQSQYRQPVDHLRYIIAQALNAQGGQNKSAVSVLGGTDGAFVEGVPDMA